MVLMSAADTANSESAGDTVFFVPADSLTSVRADSESLNFAAPVGTSVSLTKICFPVSATYRFHIVKTLPVGTPKGTPL